MAASAFVDYYAVLQVDQSVDQKGIKSSYYKLAKQHHPDRNINDPKATAKFQSIEAAYSTLADAVKRRDYDCSYARLRTKQAAAAGQPPETSKNNSNNDKAAQDNLNELATILRRLTDAELVLQKAIAGAKLQLFQVESAYRKLQHEDYRDKEEDASRKGWFGLFATQLSAEEKESRERRAIERRVAEGVRMVEMERIRASIKTMQARIDDIKKRWNNVNEEKQQKQRDEEERKMAEKARREAEEFNKRAEEARQRFFRQQAAQRAEEERERKEEMRKAAEEQGRRAKVVEEMRQRAEEQRRREKMEEERKQRVEEERKKRMEKQRNESVKETAKRNAQPQTAKARARRNRGNAKQGQPNPNSTCAHRGWWTQEQGRARCQQCQTMTYRFAFRCPGCQVLACADCRNTLKRGG